ncbi:transposase, partial [Thiolapillus sp.]
RCDGAGIPIEAQRFKTKPELALEMIRHASALGVRYNWIGADGLYGNDPTFLRALDEQGEVFLIDVHKDQQIYLEDPEPRRVEAVQKRGRKSTRWQSESTPIRVDQWLKQRPESAWKREVLRDGTKGTVTVEILHQRVWLWDGKEAKAHHWHLLVRREIKSPNEIKYSLSNASEEVSSLKLAQMQGQRYWVERSFQDGKSHAGLDHYQARGWKAW